MPPAQYRKSPHPSQLTKPLQSFTPRPPPSHRYPGWSIPPSSYYPSITHSFTSSLSPCHLPTVPPPPTFSFCLFITFFYLCISTVSFFKPTPNTPPQKRVIKKTTLLLSLTLATPPPPPNLIPQPANTVLVYVCRRLRPCLY
jgi:hypothetical protein